MSTNFSPASARSPGVSPLAAEVQLGRHTINFADRTIRTAPDGAPVRLTPTQWHVLEVLLRHPGELVSQRQLLSEVWGPRYETETNYLRPYLAQLRRKLEDDPARPRHLVTEPGMGYRFPTVTYGCRR